MEIFTHRVPQVGSTGTFYFADPRLYVTNMSVEKKEYIKNAQYFIVFAPEVVTSLV